MGTASAFKRNRAQAVRLPADVRLPEGVKKVQVRARGVDPIIAPVARTRGKLLHERPTGI